MIQLTSLFRLGVLVCLTITLSFDSPGIAWGAEAEEEAQHEVIPGDKAGELPFMGDWEGKFDAGWASELVAQVIPRGGQQYLIQLLPAFDHRCPPLAVIEATADGKSLSFEQDEWSGTLKGNTFTGTGLLRGKSTEFTLKKVIRVSPRLGTKPPPKATVLFDGGSLEHWESDGRRGITEITWKQIDNFLRVWPPLETHSCSTAMRTRDARSESQLHLEFRLPLLASATGQTRGNSGIIIEEFEFYEVQILDSYGLPGYWNDNAARLGRFGSRDKGPAGRRIGVARGRRRDRLEWGRSVSRKSTVFRYLGQGIWNGPQMPLPPIDLAIIEHKWELG